MCDFNLPVCPGPLVERGGACRAVLVAQPGGARHVVIGHHWGLHWLQGLVGSVAPGCRKTTKVRNTQTMTKKLQITLKTLSLPILTPGYHDQPWGDSGVSVWAGWSWKSSLLVLLHCSHVARAATKKKS